MARILTKEELEHINAVRKDYWRFKKNLYIRDKFGRLVLFEPNIPQTIFLNWALKELAAGRPVKAILLKARQMGMSTAVESLIYWWTITHKNLHSVILGHKEKSSRALFGMFRRYYDNSNPNFKPSKRLSNKKELVFELYDADDRQIGLGSDIQVETANAEGVGRAETINCLHASEVGEYENGEEIISGIMPTIPDRVVFDIEAGEIPSIVVLESTAKGRGTYFHTEWENAVTGKNNYTPFFFPWWVDPEYEREGEPLGKLSEYEEFLIDLFKKGCAVGGQVIKIPKSSFMRKIRFYRYKANDFSSHPELMYQEYPSTAREAFLSNGAQVFNAMALERLDNDKYDESLLDHYEIDCGEDGDFEHYSLTPVPFDQRGYDEGNEGANGRLKIYTPRIPGHEYVLAGDVAEGLKVGDYSVADVVDVSTMQTVARWRGHIDPDKFGDVCAALGFHYNYALVGVEVNNHGLTTVQRLRDIYYTNMFKREKGYDEDFEEATVNLGWKTDVRTKRIATDDLARLIRDGIIQDKDGDFIDEAFSFVKDDRGRRGAEVGAHDDTIMAKAIAYQLFAWGENDIKDLSVYVPPEVAELLNKNRIK